MKYKHGERITLVSINSSPFLNDTKRASSYMVEYKNLIPTPTASAFVKDIGPSFNESNFVGQPKILGSGFFADVYKVQHFQSNTFMAFKVPKNTESINRFMKEVKLLRYLDHDNILRFRGTCVFDGLFGCLTDYLDSGNLSGLIERHGSTLKWSTGVYIAEDIANGLVYLHQKSILHRDLSSENILLHRSSNKYSTSNSVIIIYKAVIADFGLFLDLKQQRTDRMSTVGNPFYTAPENLKNDSPYDYTSDIFSFGMILCEIITGLKNDPDKIPRTNNFGLNYKELKVKKYCPKWLHNLTCDCCMVYIDFRPSMTRARDTITDNKQYIDLWENSHYSDEVYSNFSHSMDATKQRTMSMTTHQHHLHQQHQQPPKVYTNGIPHRDKNQTVPSCRISGAHVGAICRYNSVDSFIDPRLVNLHKASKDLGYVDMPLLTSMKRLDPRVHSQRQRLLSTMHQRSCSETDLALLSTSATGDTRSPLSVDFSYAVSSSPNAYSRCS